MVVLGNELLCALLNIWTGKRWIYIIYYIFFHCCWRKLHEFTIFILFIYEYCKGFSSTILYNLRSIEIWKNAGKLWTKKNIEIKGCIL